MRLFFFHYLILLNEIVWALRHHQTMKKRSDWNIRFHRIGMYWNIWYSVLTTDEKYRIIHQLFVVNAMHCLVNWFVKTKVFNWISFIQKKWNCSTDKFIKANIGVMTWQSCCCHRHHQWTCMCKFVSVYLCQCKSVLLLLFVALALSVLTRTTLV